MNFFVFALFVLLVNVINVVQLVHGQGTRTVPVADGVSVAPDTMPPVATCKSSIDCVRMAMPCEVLTCLEDVCVFSHPAELGVLCGERDRDCVCDGVTASCSCDSTNRITTTVLFGTAPTTPAPFGIAPAPTLVFSQSPTTTALTSTTTTPSTTMTSRFATTTTTSLSTRSDPDSGATVTMPTSTHIGSTRTGTGSMKTSVILEPQTGTSTPKQAMPHPTTANGTRVDDFRQSIHSTDEQPPIPIIAGAIIGCIALLCLVVAIAYFVSRRARDSPITPSPTAIQSTSSPSSSSTITISTTPMTYSLSHMPSGTSEYGAAPVFAPSGEYGVAPPAQPYDAPPSQSEMFAHYESVRDPLQL
jgi:hypothetical protein